MLRKIDSSAGAGLNGEGLCDIEEGLEVIALAGGLPELFLGLGIVAPSLHTCCSRGNHEFDDKRKLKTSIRSRSLD